MSSILVPYENSNLEIDSCYNITIPKGTDAERTHASFSLKEGALRYNTTSNVLEFYNSSSWVSPAINLTGLSDVGTATATCGNLLIGGGASFTSQAVSGDITLAANGSTVVQTSVICSQTCAAIDSTNDYLLVVDATDNAYKKVLACDFSVCCAAVAGSSGGGTSDSADCLTTARNFSITGDITAADVSFNGTANVALSASLTAGCIVDADINASAGIAYTKMGTVPTWNQNTTGTAATVTDTAQPTITTVGTLASLTLAGTVCFTGLASHPSTPSAGWVYYNNGDNKLKVYNGTIWEDLN